MKSSRARIVLSIMQTLSSTGQFAVKGLQPFWEEFRDELCHGCRRSLDSMDADRRRALALLEEAVRLDPKNTQAKGNLATLRRML